MIHREFLPPQDGEWFRKWKSEAVTETETAKDAYASKSIYKFKTKIYGSLKEHLKSLFDKKCAYCEAYFDHVAWGDVEHYRPKGKVTEDSNHPGYYWLAYDESNLFPSCQPCNQGKGKMSQFPLLDESKRAMRPGDSLDQEIPLLLNPYTHYPSEHLVFVPGLGTVEPREKSRVGAKSIDTYQLNRESLVTMRRRAQESMISLILRDFSRPDLKKMKARLAECLRGKEEFSAAVLADISEQFRNIAEEFLELSDLFADLFKGPKKPLATELQESGRTGGSNPTQDEAEI